MCFQYAVQRKPEGIAQTLVIGKSFLEGGRVMLVLGDNFFGHDLSETLHKAIKRELGATLYASWGRDCERNGVVTLDAEGNAQRLVEKPKQPELNWAVTGLYCYDTEVTEWVSSIKSSQRAELEIIALQRGFISKMDLERLLSSYGLSDYGAYLRRMIK